MRLFNFKNLSPLAITLIVSALIHLVFIVAVNFEPPVAKFFKDKMPALDVVLVNAKTKSKPTKADALAQANLNRGGNTDANRQMKSALPPPKKQAELMVKPQLEASSSTKKPSKAEMEAERKQQKVAELEKQAQELLTQINAKNKVESSATKEKTAPQSEKGQQEDTAKNRGTADLMARSLEMARLEAQIAKDQDDYQKRPKRKSIGARTQEYRFAAYVENWRQKIEKIGSLNYPEAAKAQRLHGQLRMTVFIKSDGSIEKIEIVSSSGSRILDNAARRIVELAAPYAPFPDEIRKEVDILDVTRTWSFTEENSVTAE